MLRFPFWIVTQRRGFLSKPVEASDPSFVVAFTSAERAASFMVSRGETEWENRLVSRASLRDLITDLRLLGIQGLCVDPSREGAGMQVTFDEFLASP